MSKQTFMFEAGGINLLLYSHWESFELISKKLPPSPFLLPAPSISLPAGPPEPPDCLRLREGAESGEFNLLPWPREQNK